jgi:hypothetical protein
MTKIVTDRPGEGNANTREPPERPM